MFVAADKSSRAVWSVSTTHRTAGGGVRSTGAASNQVARWAVAGTDAADADWQPVDALLTRKPGLALDHGQILGDALERARAKLEYTPLAAAFCPEKFTIGELRRVYETVWGFALDPRNFHRKASKTPGFLLPTGKRRRATAAGQRSSTGAAPSRCSALP
jgi:ADP-ribose pyrophosphatase YjhB (NUDIX family)